MKTIFLFFALISGLTYGAMKEVDKQFIPQRTFLENPGFESGKAGWINSGGTFTVDTGTPLIGGATGVYDATAALEYLETALFPIEPGARGGVCSVSFLIDYPAGASGDYVYKVIDNLSNEIVAATPIAITPTGQPQQQKVFFTCPVLPAVSIKARIEATLDGGQIKLDQGFLGFNQDNFSVDTASFVGGISHPNGVANCTPTIASHNTGLQSFVADGDCSVFTSLGSKTTVTGATGVPEFTIEDLPAGEYFGLADMLMNSTTLTDGTYSCFESMNINGSDGNGFSSGTSIQSLTARVPDNQGGFSFHFTHTGGDATFEYRGGQSGGTAARCFLALNGGSLSSFTIKVYRMPGQPVDAINLLTSGEYWDVNIGGANPDLSNTIVTAYAAISNPTLDMVVNTGSASAQIPCVANASNGLTCAAGDEVVGIVLNASTGGLYEACLETTHTMNVNASSLIASTFQWVQTNNADTTILQEGKSRVTSELNVGAVGSSIQTSRALHTCGFFNFASGGQKTLKLFFEQRSAGTVNSNFLAGDRAALDGQHDMHIVVRKINQSMPSPVFTGILDDFGKRPALPVGTTPNLKKAVVLFNCGPSSTITKQTGTFMASISNIASGACTLTTTGEVTDLFNVQLTESGSVLPRSLMGIASFTAGNPTTFNVDCRNNEGAADCTNYVGYMEVLYEE